MFIQYWRLCAALVVAARLLSAQGAKPAPDVIVFVDGERLVGHFEQSDGASVKFKSDMVGEITVDWSKVKELHTAGKFAVLPPGADLGKHSDLTKIPQGAIAAGDGKITVTPATGAPQTVAVGDAAHVVEESDFENAVHGTPNFFSEWGGTITAGASLVQATQQSRTFNTAVALVRTIPDEDWLRRRNRTTVDFSAAYGTVEQPNTATVKTEIYHASAERDEYLSASLFGFAETSFDHNFSQGLNLEQSYGGGLGWSLLKRSNQSLDLKAGITYVRQSFAEDSPGRNLSGSTFEEDYRRGLRHGMEFTEQLIFSPAWNNPNALSAAANALVTVPVYRKMNFSFGSIDNYLHDPPPGFRKNSLQLTMGLTYALR